MSGADEAGDGTISELDVEIIITIESETRPLPNKIHAPRIGAALQDRPIGLEYDFA